MKPWLFALLLSLVPFVMMADETTGEPVDVPAAVEGESVGSVSTSPELDEQDVTEEEAAKEEAAKATHDNHASNAAGSDGEGVRIYGADKGEGNPVDPTTTWMGRGFTLMGYLLMIGALGVAAIWLFRNNPRFRAARGGTSRAIRVAETRALGQKQFLAIVECDGRRMLLGISPGRMNFLCSLSPEDEREDDVFPAVQPEGDR